MGIVQALPVIMQLIFILVNIALAASLPTEIPSYDEVVDTRIVNREEEQRSDISGSLVSDVKQINVLLNIPNNCNANTIYDDMIRQINNCKTGSDRGHPNLKSGCLLQIDFTRLKTDCQNSNFEFSETMNKCRLPTRFIIVQCSNRQLIWI